MPAAIDQKTQRRIWGDRGFRVFLSHRSSVKVETRELAESLKLYGVSAFVAHVDIKPSRAWTEEIESALATMEALAALLTPDFHESEWVDQEIGYGLGRGVQVFPVNLDGIDPYGFLARIQALTCDWSGAPAAIASVLINIKNFLPHYISALENCGSFDAGNALARPLSGIEDLSLDDAKSLMNAYNANFELQGSFAFNGSKPSDYGPGLLSILQRFHPKNFKSGRDGKIAFWL